MSKKLVWDAVGEREYQTGVDKGVLYPINTSTATYPKGVAWNGITGVTDSPEGAETTDLYADNAKYLTMMSAEKLKLTIEAYMYPDEFKACLGAEKVALGASIFQQKHTVFGFSYRTLVGNDVAGTDAGYKIHLVYGCLASPSETSNSTVNESPEAATLSFEVSTTPVPANEDGTKKTASMEIDSRDFKTEAEKAKLAALEAILYGSDEADARLPLPEEVITLLGVAAA